MIEIIIGTIFAIVFQFITEAINLGDEITDTIRFVVPVICFAGVVCDYITQLL